MVKIKYLDEKELEAWDYYYVHSVYPEYRGNKPKELKIRQWNGSGWVCNGLGSGGSFKAIDKVPMIDIEKYAISEK